MSFRATCFSLLALCSLTTPLPAQSSNASAPDLGTGAARLSPTLYFPDAASEVASRRSLHLQVEQFVSALAAPGIASAVHKLDRGWSLVTASQRHAAYLKVQHLENMQDTAIEHAIADVDADRSVLLAAMDRFLQRLPVSQASSLGSYTQLARDAHAQTTHSLSPEAERYRSAVLPPLQQDISDAYDKLTASIPREAALASPDTVQRRAALARRTSAYDAAAPVAASLLAVLVDAVNRDAVQQGFPDAAARKYDSLGLNGSIVTATIGAVQAEADAYRDFQQVQAEHAAHSLGVPSITSEEQDLVSSTPTSYSLTQGRALILGSLAPLGQDYVDRFTALLDPANGRLDLTGGPHRAATGTSIAVYDAPVALYYGRYDGTLRSLSTLAHEGGHAIHRELMNAAGIPVYEREGPHLLSEGFAIFNELLLLDHAAAVAPTPAAKAEALQRLLSKIALELFVSAEEAGFERSLYREASGHALLDRTRIDALYQTSLVPFESWPTSDISASRGWMRKSLLFQDPLYLVNYLYAAFVAVALFEKSHTDPHFAAVYSHLLKRGFDADPQTLLASIGIRLDDPSLLKAAISLFRSRTDELRTIYAAQEAVKPSSVALSQHP